MFKDFVWQTPFWVEFLLMMGAIGLGVTLLGVAYGIWILGWKRFRNDIRGSIRYLLRDF